MEVRVDPAVEQRHAGDLDAPRVSEELLGQRDRVVVDHERGRADPAVLHELRDEVSLLGDGVAMGLGLGRCTEAQEVRSEHPVVISERAGESGQIEARAGIAVEEGHGRPRALVDDEELVA